MKKTITILTAFLLIMLAKNTSAQSQLDCKNFYFSEFDNGNANNKALEIFNPQGISMSLNGYTIQVSIFGQILPDTIHLSGTISPKGTYVLASYSASPAIIAFANQIVIDSNMVNTLEILLVNPLGKPIDKIGSTLLAQWLGIPYSNFYNKTFKRNFFQAKGDTSWVSGQSEWNIDTVNFRDLHHHRSVCSASDDFYITLTNQTLDCSNDFVDVSINAEVDGDDNTKLNYSEVEIAYDTTIFGSYIASTVQFTGASSPLDASYYPITIIDNAAGDGIDVFFGDASNTTNPDSMASGTSYPFYDLKFPIKKLQCSGQSSGISFNSISASSVNLYPYRYDSVYTDSTGTYTYLITVWQQAPYNTTNFVDGSFSDIHCAPRIDNVAYPADTLDAGTNQSTDILTINGKYFNASIGTGDVMVSDANQAGSIGLDPYDIVSWSDNQIKVKMPNVLFAYPNSTPGSGPISLYNDCGYISNDVNINILYNILNLENSSTSKLRYNLVMADAPHSLTFRCDTSVSHNVQAYACVKKAVKEINCYTGVNWIVGDTITQATIMQDNISNIFFADPSSFPDTVTLMQTKSQFLPCGSVANLITYSYEADIKMQSHFTGAHQWSYDTTGAILASNYEYFYDAILHELLHAMLLDHVNDINDIMSSDTPLGYRPTLTSTNSPLVGAFNVVQTSASCPSYCTYTPLVPSTINCIFAGLGVNNITQNQFQLNVYPNPAHDGEITIAYQLTKNSNVQFTMYDYTGKEIIALNKQNKEAGTHTQQLDLSNLASGIYLLMANIDGQYQSIKIIKS